MCGITGIFRTGGDAAIQLGLLDRMTDALAHRGPDARGTWSDASAGVALGHRRLAIIDLSETGRQPMSSADGRSTITFNGEIYNYRDLRAELEAEGVRFRGSSDTEVILEAVSRWGIDKTLERLVGMFAFGLWDAREKRLTLARDRFGEKPLHYAWVGETLVFASEIKAILAYPGVETAIDRESLASYVQRGYVPAPRTIYTGVSKLPPAHVLSVGADTKAAHARPYWSARDVAERAHARPFESEPVALDALDAAIRRAVQRATVADVPVGVFLSGGIDSSLVAASLQAQSDRPILTFTIGFDETGYDESADAKRVSDHLGTSHTSLKVTADEARDVLPLLPTLYDEPLADSSQIPTYLVSKLARRHVTVALSGDGGDELFGGYNRHVVLAELPHSRAARAAGRIAERAMLATPPRAWDKLGRAAGRIPLRRTRRLARVPALGAKVHKLARALAAPRERTYDAMASLWSPETALVVGAPPRPPGEVEAPAGWSDAERAMLADALTYLPDDILAKVDRASMAVSLETRAPFLSHEVFEAAWRLPERLRVRDGTGKWALREVLARYVPREMFDRPKSGFAIPLADWLRGPLRAWAEALLDEGRLRREGHFHPTPIRQAWEEHLSGARDRSAELWVILSFQAWHERHHGAAP